MNFIGYYVAHTFLNSLKKIFRSWVGLVIFVMLFAMLVGGVLGGTIGVIMGETFPEEEPPIEDTVPDDGTVPGDLNGDGVADEKDRAVVMAISEVVIGGVFLIVMLITIHNAEKNGASIFLMADVNLLFPSPQKPQTILLFRNLLQVATALAGTVYMIFQLPNLILNLGLSVWEAVGFLVLWCFLIVFSRFLAVFVYTIGTTYPKMKKFFSYLPYIVLFLLAALLFFTMRIKELDALNAAFFLFASPASRFIPLWGWFKGGIIYLLEGNLFLGLLLFLFTLLSCGLMILFTWKMRPDFYEDALENAKKVEETKAAATEGRQVEKKRSEKLRRGDGDSIVIGKGTGASIFFTKSMYNRKRFGFLFLFTKTAGTYLATALLLGLLMKLAIGMSDLVFPMVFLGAILLFRTIGDPISEESAHHFLALVPESAHKKIFYCFLAGVTNAALDLLPAMLVLFVLLLPNPIELLLWYLLLLATDAFSASMGFLIQAILPTDLPKTVSSMIQMTMLLLSLLPLLLTILLGTILGFLPIFLIGGILISFAGTAVFFALGALFLHRGKK